jgi:hypothetical protein
VVTDVTAVVEIVKLVVVRPCATVIVAGTVAFGLSLERPTAAPPTGAAAVRVTVPVEELLPTTDWGFRVTFETAVPETTVRTVDTLIGAKEAP